MRGYETNKVFLSKRSSFLKSVYLICTYNLDRYRTCLLSVVFPNYELFISISLLINVISPLFNHVAYRRTVNKSSENAIREKTKSRLKKKRNADGIQR